MCYNVFLYKQRPQIKQDFLLKYMRICEKGISVKGEEAVRYRLIKCHISLYLIMSFHLISSQNEKKNTQRKNGYTDRGSSKTEKK